MIVLATASSPAADIAAASGLISAVLLAWVAFRAQSAREQLNQIREIVENAIDAATSDPGRTALVNERIKKAFREALREVLGGDSRNRRWYDREE